MTRANLEALLFVSAKPLTVRECARVLSVKDSEVKEWLNELEKIYSGADRGVALARNSDSVQLFSAPATCEFIENYLKEEITGELTRPQLETLTIIAYRGPISKPEIEQIRGVNCAVILKNLVWRGLVEETEASTEEISVWRVTMEFVRFLGLTGVEKLPNYEELRVCEILSP